MIRTWQDPEDKQVSYVVIGGTLYVRKIVEGFGSVWRMPRPTRNLPVGLATSKCAANCMNRPRR